MNKHMTLGQLVKFVLNNRRGKAFTGYSEHCIASGILRAARDGTMLYAISDKTNEPCGVVTAYADRDNKLMYVHDILTTEPWVLKTFVVEFSRRWPGYTIFGLRYGKEKRYNTGRLVNHFVKGACYGWQ